MAHFLAVVALFAPLLVAPNAPAQELTGTLK
jgi:hypothetical protein